MIYFNNLKQAFNQPIEDYVCIIPDEIWLSFGLNAKVGVDYDINLETGQFIDLRQTPEYIAEELEKAKALKIAETETKLDEKRYSFDFTVVLQDKECEFDTTKKTQDDLQTAAIVTSMGATYPDWVTNNGIKLDLTFEDVQTVFNAIFPLVSPLYIKQMEYIEQIKQAETIEEVKAIVIDYSEDTDV